jgi:hypothetical protein
MHLPDVSLSYLDLSVMRAKKFNSQKVWIDNPAAHQARSSGENNSQPTEGAQISTSTNLSSAIPVGNKSLDGYPVENRSARNRVGAPKKTVD